MQPGHPWHVGLGLDVPTGSLVTQGQALLQGVQPTSARGLALPGSAQCQTKRHLEHASGRPSSLLSPERWEPSSDRGLSRRLSISLATGAFPSLSVFLQVRPGSNGRAALWRVVWEVPSPCSERLTTKTLPLTESGAQPAWRWDLTCDLSTPVLARVLPCQSRGPHLG